MGNFYNNAVLTPFFFDKEYDYSDGTITDIPGQLAQEAKSDNVFIGRYVKVLAPGKYNQSIWQKVLDSAGMRYELVADLDSPADEVTQLKEEIETWFDEEKEQTENLQNSLTSIKLNDLQISEQALDNDAGTEVTFTLTAQTINAVTGSAQDNPQSVSATMTVNNKIFWQEF